MDCIRHVVLALSTLSVVFALPVRADDEECLACHGAAADVVELEARQRVDEAKWTASVHAQMGFGCAECHTGKDEFPHPEGAEPARCANCHDEVLEAFGASVHAGNQRKEGSVWPAEDPCAMCHGVHDVLPVDDPESPSHFRNVPETCLNCHGDYAIAEAAGLSATQAQNYRQSVHGLNIDNPDAKPAVCTDCHDHHRIIAAVDPSSRINPFNLPGTCGSCHAGVAEEYTNSVHGEAFRRGVSASPTCTDCHGIHSIKMVVHEDVAPEEARLVRSTCPACHASEALMREYGVTPDRVSSYRASYHGLAQKRGSTAVADCASCHGIHAIYPQADPRSSVNPGNLQSTCGGCHAGAGEEFSKQSVHFAIGARPQTAGGEDTAVATWITRAYWALIVVVIGGMIGHNAIILGHHIRRKVRHERSASTRRRFSTSQKVQHGILALTFILLAVTGFMLAYPDTWWSRALADQGITESVRRWIHRGAALGLIATAVYHVGWITFTRYGRRELGRLRPGLRDFREFAQNMRLHSGRSDLGPAFDKYDYPAKAEYWSLVWGTVVMAATGFVLWFPVEATSFLPFWAVKVSEVIHLFEAWLATLAILFFHFFYVMGHPEIYPISLAMFTGRIPEEEARHRHPAWEDDEQGPEPSSVTTTEADKAGETSEELRR